MGCAASRSDFRARSWPTKYFATTTPFSGAASNDRPATPTRRRAEAAAVSGNERSGFVLTSIARRLMLVAATGLWLSSASAGTPASLQGAIPGPAGKFTLKDASGNGNKTVGIDGRIGIMVVLDGEPAAKTYRHALVAAGSQGVTAATVAGAASGQTVNKLR